MIADVDRAVALEAVKLITTLKMSGFLGDESRAVSTTLKVMCHATNLQPAQWNAIAALLQLQLRIMSRRGGAADANNGLGANSGLDKSVSPDSNTTAISEGSASHLSSSPLVQLAILLRASRDYDTGPYPSKQPGGLTVPVSEPIGALDLDQDDVLDSLCKEVVEAMRAIEPAITDWPSYAKLLTANAELDETVDVRPITVPDAHVMLHVGCCLDAAALASRLWPGPTLSLAGAPHTPTREPLHLLSERNCAPSVAGLPACDHPPHVCCRHQREQRTRPHHDRSSDRRG